MKAVICGAGIAGLGLAQRLGAQGWRVVVVEKAPTPREQGYMIDFWGLGYDAAELMGALPRLKELSHPVREWTYVNESGVRVAGLDQRGFLKAQRGRLLTVPRPHIELAVRERIGGDVDLRYGRTIASVQDTGEAGGPVRLTLSDGTAEQADLLVGADGVHSAVRGMIFGPERRYLRHLGFHMAAWLFDDPEVHRRLAGRFCFTDSYGRQLGVYGVGDGRVTAFAVHRTGDPRIPADVRKALREEYGSLRWIVPRALGALPAAEDIYYDQMAQIELPRWSRGRVTLLGDACAAVSPLASQGASLALAGGHLLARRLETTGSVQAALAAYERVWRPIVASRQRGARRGANWFLPASPAALLIRRAGIRLTGLPGVSDLISAALGGRPGVPLARLAGGPETETLDGVQQIE
ncbi:FAD-dependent oxidoreductase [Spongiactinospora gelatinilytica]|uniref:FAD-dependent oxidoreductase n=1 Tax=Spongiactinospora gelatinilytica TaxID=2666298 RepID=A0A2W2HG93_9ACTN|nr:FAD-dependent monooxygenase [Spongiactinospora gelatinilytica]PZG54019.1 FAD-dependent oxidoreductase [Spongiactinospora gelatinilytica]